MSDKDDPIRPGGALDGPLFRGFLRRLTEVREPKPGVRIGPWRIVREVGRGGSGVVYLAERADGAFTQEVALKWLRGDRPALGARQALERERELLTGLDHPNIARLIDGGRTEQGMLWFAMDYVPGEHVDHHCRDLSVTERVELIRALCRAVHYAHSRGLIHGDIKPSNVLVDSRGQPRLVDFGVARIKGAEGTGHGLTPEYASPQQRAGQAPTTASDVWQLGRLFESVLDGMGTDRDLQAVIELATSEAPEARYASVSALESDLTAWLKTRPVAARDGGHAYRLGRLVQRNKPASVLAAAALLVLAGFSVWFTWQLADERDLARAEAARAEAALEETEAALARAEALRAFLIDLFRAAEPDRPRDELPSTEELLALGARRALDEDAASPGERLGMLLTLGEVYLARGQEKDAEPLLDAAVALGRERAEQQPLDLARALELKARLALRRFRMAEAEEWLLEAEPLAEGLDPGWNTYASIREYRAQLAAMRGNYHDALEMVEPVYLGIQQGREVQPRVHHRVLTRVSWLYATLGDPARALEIRNQATDLVERMEGEESLAHAMEHHSRSGLHLRLGQFDAAERNLRKALEIYDRIAEHPLEMRAVSYRNLARVNFYTGRYRQAMSQVRRSSEEWAAAQGRDSAEHEFSFLLRGLMQAYIQRWESAESSLRRARSLLDEPGAQAGPWLAMTEGLLAFVACHQGRIEEGASLLAEVHARPGAVPLDDPDLQAHILTARAACQYRADQHEQALAAIDRALETSTSPGYAMLHAERRILHARILAELGRDRQAAETLGHAQRQLEELGLAEHPVMQRIQNARRALP